MRFLALLLLPLAGLASSSSGADDDGGLFVRAQGKLERLWGGVLDCADGHGPYAVRNRLDDSGGFEDIDGEAAPTGGRVDYSECGRRALRVASSQFLLDSIEDSLRQAGLSAFENSFQLDSSVSWVYGGNVRGEADAVIPVWSQQYGDGTGSAFFMQPGVVLWSGLEGAERIDANFGLVLRSHLDADTIAGGSLFYDHDFERGHRRIGAGVDVQSGVFTGRINYYHPLTGWRGGREDYEEQGLRGVDFRLGLLLDRIRLDGSVGAWRFVGEPEQEKDDWRTSFGADAGFRVLPGIFVEGGYEHHDSRDSLGSRWNAGLAFRFALPGLEGSDPAGGRYGQPDLWRIVEREKRVLYEERLGIPRLLLSVEDPRITEGDTAVVSGVLTGALDEDVDLHLMPHTTMTATHGTDNDFTLAHKVYEAVVDEAAGSAAAEDAASDCPSFPCVVAIPAGATRFDVLVAALPDSDNEVDEHVDLRVDVPAAHSGLFRSRDVARVTIAAHGNTIAFAPASDTELLENTAGPTSSGAIPVPGTAEVSVSVDLPAPVPITLNVDVDPGSTAGPEDYSMPSTLTIPAGQPGGSITLTGIDDSEGEGNEALVLSLSAAGSLLEGWTLDETATHEMTIRDDDLAIGFEEAGLAGREPITGRAEFAVAVELTAPPEAELIVPVEIDAAGTTARVSGGSEDAAYAPASLTFAAGDTTLSKEITFTVNADDDAENEEAVRLRIGDHSSHGSNGNDFSIGQGVFTLTIPANDNVISFDATSDRELEENSGTAEVRVNVNLPAPQAITLNVDVGSSSTAEPEDYSLPSTVTIQEGQPGVAIALTGARDDEPEGSESIVLSLSAAGGLPEGWALDETATHEVTIRDDDLAIGFAVSERAEPEPAAGTTTFTVAVELTASPEATLTVPIGIDTTTTSASVSAGGDVAYAPTSLTFAAGATTLSQDISFTVRADSVAEGDERLRLRISDDNSFTSGGNDFSVGRRTFDLNIRANDNVIRLGALADSSIDEEESLTVSLTTESSIAAPSSGLPIVVTVAPQGSASDEDVDVDENQLFSGSPPFSFDIAAVGDDEAEASESFEISISEGANFPSGWGRVDSATTTFTIPANDNIIELAPASTQFTLEEHAATVQSGTVILNIDNPAALTSALSGDITLTHTTTMEGDEDDNAANDIEVDDFVIDASTGQAASGGIGINVLLDAVPELDETATIAFEDGNDVLPKGWSVNADNSALTVAIPANDNEFTLGAPSRAAIGEGEDGGATLKLSFTNPPPSETVLRIDFEDIDGSGVERDEGELDVSFSADKGANYSKTDETLTIPAGTTSPVTLTVEAEDDMRPEAAESFTLQLSDSHASNSLPDGFIVASGQARHAIQINAADNTVGFATASSELVEGTPLSFSDGNLVIKASEQLPNQADLPTFILSSNNPDLLIRRTHERALYNSSSGELAVRSGSADNAARRPRVQEVEISLGIAADDDAMSEEATVTLGLKSGESLPDGWTLGRTTHTVNISDTDGPIARTVFFETDGAEIAEDGGSVGVVLRISPPPNTPVSIPVAVTGDSDAYTAEVGAQGASFAGMVDFAAYDGNVRLFLAPEDDDNAISEVVVFAIGTLPENYTAAEHSSWTVTINDIDAPKGDVGFASGQPQSAAEGGTVALTAVSSVMADVDLEIAWKVSSDDTVDDVDAPTGVATIPGGMREATFDIGIRADGAAEDSEIVDIKLEGPSLPRGWYISSAADEHRIAIDASDNTVGFSAASLADARVLVAGASTDGGTSVDISLSISGALSQAGAVSLASDNPDVQIVPRAPTTATYSGTTLTIPTGEEEIFLTVTSVEDSDETHDAAILTLANPSLPTGWEIDPAADSLSLSIRDLNAANVVSFAVPGEGDSFNPSHAFEATLNSVPVRVESSWLAPMQGFDLRWDVASGGDQLVPVSRSGGDIDFDGGEDYKDFDILIENDRIAEDATPVVLRLSSPTSLPAGWNFGAREEYTLVIEPSDGVLRLAPSLADTTAGEGETVAASLSSNVDAPSSGLPITVLVAPQGDAAAEDVAFEASQMIVAGEREHGFDIEIIDDEIAETADETFVVGIEAGSGFPADWGTVSTDTRTITVPPSDIVVGFSQATATALESSGDTASANLRVVPPPATLAMIPVTLDATGTAGINYEIALMNVEPSGGSVAYSETEIQYRGHQAGGIDIAVSAVQDDDAMDERIVIAIDESRLPTGWEIGDHGSLTIHIREDDKIVGFAEASSSVAEDASGGTASVMLTSALEAPDPIMLNVSTGGTAREGDDYSLSSQSVTIPKGGREAALRISIFDDEIGEGNETIELTLSASESLPEGWRLGTARHTLAISDDDKAIGFTVAMQDVEEPAGADEDYAGGAGVLVTQSPAAALTVEYEVLSDFSSVPGLPAGATAATTSGSSADIVFPASKTLSFAADATGDDLMQGLTGISIKHDEEAEGDEYAVLRIKSHASFTADGNEFAVSPEYFIIRIPANDNKIGFADMSSSVMENIEGGMASLPVNVDLPAPSPITLDVSVGESGTTATQGEDYAPATGRLTISAGQETGTIEINIVNDNIREDDEDIVLSIAASGSLPDGWSLGATRHALTIVNDDREVSFTGTSPPQTMEDNGDTVSQTLLITPRPATNVSIPIIVEGNAESYSLKVDRPDSATISGGKVNFPPGHSTVLLAIRAVVDGNSDDEEIRIRIDAANLPESYSVGERSSWSVRIIDADKRTVSFRDERSDEVLEGRARVNRIRITPPLDGNVSIPILIDGSPDAYTVSASEPAGASVLNNMVNFVQGQGDGSVDSVLVRVDAVEDEDYLDDDIVIAIDEMNLPPGYKIGATPSWTVPIIDNDRTVDFSMAMQDVGEPDATGSYSGGAEVRLAGSPAADVTVQYAVVAESDFGDVPGLPADAAAATTSGSGADIVFPADKTFTFVANAAGDDLAQALADIRIVADDIAEGDEYAVLQILPDDSFATGGNRFLVGTGYFIIKIPTNDNTIGFAEAETQSSVLESVEGGMANVVVNIDLPAPTPITLDVAATDLTATAGEDYSLAKPSLTIDAGQDMGMIQIAITDDDDVEGDEVVALTISTSGSLPNGWSLGRTTHALAIADDERAVGFAPYSGVYDSGIDGIVNQPLVTEDAERVLVRLESTRPAPMGGFDLRYDVTQGASRLASTHQDGGAIAFPEGEDEANFTITWTDDDNPEEEATVILRLSSPGGLPTGADFGRREYAFTLVDDDNRIGFAYASSSVMENVDSGMAIVPVSVSGLVPSPIALDVSVSADETTATRGEDYSLATRSLTIEAGQESAMIQLNIANDSRYEEDEDVVLSIIASDILPRGWSLGTASHKFTIVNDDREVSFTGKSPPQTMEVGGDFVFPRLLITPPLADDVTIPLIITGDSDAYSIEAHHPENATLSDDGKVKFVHSDGYNTVALKIAAKEDEDSEDEEIRIRIDAANLPESYSVGERDTWSVNIIDKDKFTVSFSEPTGNAEEDGDAATVDLEIFPPLAANVTIPLIVEGDSDAYSMITVAAPDGASISSDGTMVSFNQAEDADSVTLSLVPARDDDGFDDEITLTIDAAKLPNDYEVSSLPSAVNSWTVRISDIDKRIVSFRSAEDSSATENGSAVTNHLDISPMLEQDIAIPLKIIGDTDAYSIRAISPPGASISGGVVYFDQSRNWESVALEFQATNDVDGNDESITLAIDEDNLPPGYGVDANHSWKINIADNDTREVGFRYANTTAWGAQHLPERDIFPHLQIYVSPPLESGQNPSIPLLIEGEAGSWEIRSDRDSDPRFESNGENAVTVHFNQSRNADFVTLRVQGHQDIDNIDDQVIFTIDGNNLPDGLYLGSNTSWELNIIDNGKPSFFFWSRSAVERNCVAVETVNDGEFITVEIRVRPPYPQGTKISATGDIYSNNSGPTFNIQKNRDLKSFGGRTAEWDDSTRVSTH